MIVSTTRVAPFSNTTVRTLYTVMPPLLQCDFRRCHAWYLIPSLNDETLSYGELT